MNYFSFAFVAAFFFLAGCGDNQNNTKKPEKENKPDPVAELKKQIKFNEKTKKYYKGTFYKTRPNSLIYDIKKSDSLMYEFEAEVKFDWSSGSVDSFGIPYPPEIIIYFLGFKNGKWYAIKKRDLGSDIEFAAKLDEGNWHMLHLVMPNVNPE